MGPATRAVASGLAKMLYDEWRATQMRTPFPTSSRPPLGYTKS